MSERILVFELEIPIRWGDMDAMGHVNNTVYFRYMEQVRISWFDTMGFTPDPSKPGLVIIDARCTFLRELVYPGTVLVRQYVGRMGRSSCESYVDMFRTDDPETLCAQGAAKLVWVEFPKRKSAPLPEAIRRAVTTPRVRQGGQAL